MNLENIEVTPEYDEIVGDDRIGLGPAPTRRLHFIRIPHCKHIWKAALVYSSVKALPTVKPLLKAGFI